MPVLSVLLIDIVLSGDNAIVIALACRALPPHQKKKAILLGSGLAVLLRCISVVVVTFLMRVPYLQFVGGLALVYIGFGLLVGGEEDEHIEAADNLAKAVKTIIIADFIMCLDNVLAIAGVAKGDWLVIIIGLAISVPCVVFGAQILSAVMSKWPVVVYIGAGLIAYTAAEMIVTDAKTVHYLEPYALVIKAAVVLGVLGYGYWIHKKRQAVYKL